jgi:cell wall-associated NlpC family hydrolase
MKLRYIYYFISVVCLLSSCGTSKYGAQKRTNGATKVVNNYHQNTKETKETKKTKDAEKIAKYAGSFTGTRYRSGGTTPKGFDCSGFTQYVFKEFNYRLPRTAREQSKAGRSVDKRKDIRPGDLVFFTGSNQKSRTPGHVGIVVEVNGKGNFLFIHSSSSRGITVSSDTESYYKARYLTARRIIKQ